MKITVIQPPYFAGERPDEKIADFLINELEKIDEGSLAVLPEYSNAGGISDAESERAAMPRAKEMLKKAAEIAKKAEPSRMWLTHFSPSLVRPDLFMDTVREVFPEAVAARDGQEITLNFEEE
jgi:predicted amidohydrolase